MTTATTTATAPKARATAPRLHNPRTTARPQFGAHCIPVASGAATPATDPRTPRASPFGRHLAQAAAAKPISQHKPARIATGTGTGGYEGAELAPYAGRPGAMDAYALPSRMGNRLHYRDGRVETLEA